MRSKRATKSSLRRVAVAGDGATLGNSGPDSVVNCEGVFGGFEAIPDIMEMLPRPGNRGTGNHRQRGLAQREPSFTA